MAFDGRWDAEKMLDMYIYDYLVKRNMRKAAEIFAKEADVDNDPVAIDVPHAFLTEWWTIFWDIYSAGLPTHTEAMGRSSVKPTQSMENEQQNICPTMNQQRPRQFPISADFDKMMGQSVADLSASKNKLTVSKPSSSHSSHSWQQISQKAQQQTARDKNHVVTLGRNIPVDSAFYGAPKAKLHDAGMEKGANLMLLNGWPFTGVDQISSRMAYPVLNSILPVSNQQQYFQTSMAHHQQELFSQAMEKTLGKQIYPFQGNTNNLGNMMLPRKDLIGADEQMMVPGRHTAEQQMVVPKKQTAEHQTMAPMRQTVDQNMMATVRQMAEQQQNDPLAQQKLHETIRKRKKLSSSQAESALDGKDAEVPKPSNNNIESFLSNDDDNTDIMSTQHPSACSINEQNGFSFKTVGSLNLSKGKVLCCHFSSDGKLLASAGHDKKVLLWKMSNFDSVDTAEEHSHLITDVRFRPSSSVFATSSFDRTVQIWDAKKGASRQVRFQPRVGNLLATASGNKISLYDVETNSLQYCLEEHVKEVRSICWDTSGKYIVSVSEDSARVWSVVSGGKSTHVLHSNGNKFESCTFHPAYSQVLVIGSYQSLSKTYFRHKQGKPRAGRNITLDFWNPAENNKTLTIGAHHGIITALADSPQTEMIASASHDGVVTLWR
ncbi:hypothetical protein TEA_004489 [Camellia sinensis var. sinensis]|uniref:LisH domain-containing protein n=1 Tax=Camellia sinensis var. sinensis TaxID=542762 RepID=A0A4V3WP49_CAMSN|nr:hypothetical protein TEA_004489 [Camellia sinensis var. sinensis]